MTDVIRTLLDPSAGYRSPHVARFMWQLDDQTQRLLQDVAGITPEELRWQFAPGFNTVGMLLAHIAVAEAHLTAVGLEGKPDSDLPAVIGIAMDDDGMPLPADGAPPAALYSRHLTFFEDLLQRARANTRRVCAELADADLARQVTRTRPDGSQRVFNVDWVLYHMVEHEAGHRAQIGLLRHLYRLSHA